MSTVNPSSGAGGAKPARKAAPSAKSAEQWISEACAERDAQKAKAIYLAGIAQWPGSARLLLFAARHLRHDCDDPAGADSLLRRAIAAGPASECEIEDVVTQLCETPDGWREAADFCRGILAREPRNTFVIRQLAGILVRNPGDLDAAEPLYRQAVRIAPRDHHCLVDLCFFLRTYRGDPAAAARYAARAARLPGEHCKRHLGRQARCLAEARRNAAIERPLRRILARQPRNTAARQALGRFLISHRYQFAEGDRLLRGTVPPEQRTSAALRAIARMIAYKPRDAREWIFQIEWAALLAPYHPGIARIYAALQHPCSFPYDEYG